MPNTANNLYYTTHKHPFEALPSDSVTCRWCKRSFADELHSNVPTEPETINTLEIIGPFDDYRVTVNGYRIPYLSAVRHDGLISLALDDRLGCDIPDDERALPVIDFIANAMAVAAGYTCFGENSQPLNQFRRRLTALDLVRTESPHFGATEITREQ